eukprot:1757553-Prymnesium_polylepis.1
MEEAEKAEAEKEEVVKEEARVVEGMEVVVKEAEESWYFLMFSLVGFGGGSGVNGGLCSEPFRSQSDIRSRHRFVSR